MNTLTPNAPAAVEVKVTVTDKDGIVFGDRQLKPGREYTIPAELAERWSAQGRAVRETTMRVVALGDIAVGVRVLERGDVADISGVPEYVLKTGRVLQLGPGEPPPSPLPIDPGDRLWWLAGPMVAVESVATGELLKSREERAIDDEAYNRSRIVGELTPAGREYRESLARWRASGAVERPAYGEIARKFRRAAEKAAAPAARDPGREVPVRVVSRLPVEVGGRKRQPGDEFKVAEALAAEPFAAGKLDILGRASPRFDAFVERLQRYRASIRAFPDADHKYPVY